MLREEFLRGRMPLPPPTSHQASPRRRSHRAAAIAGPTSSDIFVMASSKNAGLFGISTKMFESIGA